MVDPANDARLHRNVNRMILWFYSELVLQFAKLICQQSLTVKSHLKPRKNTTFDFLQVFYSKSHGSDS